MRIFIAVFNNDEIISQSFDVKICYNNVGYKVKSKYINKVGVIIGNTPQILNPKRILLTSSRCLTL
jgi:hypothetical protein